MATGAMLYVTGATCVVIARIATATSVTLTTIGAICGATIAMCDMTGATSVTTVTTNAKTVTSTKLHSAAKKRRELLAAFCLCAEHGRQLEGESPFHNLIEVK